MLFLSNKIKWCNKRLLFLLKAQQVSVLECESLKLKEEMLTSLLETARKSKSDTEGRLEELQALVSKVSKCVHSLLWLLAVIKMSWNNINFTDFRDKKRICILRNNSERRFLLKAN